MNNTTAVSKRQQGFRLQDAAGEILGPDWPVSYCLKRAISLDGAIELRHNGEHASFHGVQTCKSAWSCPICARRILGARRAEIERVLEVAQGSGWRSLFVTLTLSHHTGSRLEELLKALTAAWRSVFSGDRTGERRVFERVKGQIKALEVRYGRNGWHPHLHVLLLVDLSGLDGQAIENFEAELSETLFRRYARKVEKLGMRTERDGYNMRRVDIAGAAAHYVTKISSAVEITSPDTKTGRNEREPSYSAFQLLSLYESGEREVYGRDISGLFVEYAEATKGKRAVSYSRGLKALGVELAEDDAELPEETPVRVLAVLSHGLWRQICERRMRGDLLAVAESGDENAVRAWLVGFQIGDYRPPGLEERCASVNERGAVLSAV